MVSERYTTAVFELEYMGEIARRAMHYWKADRDRAHFSCCKLAGSLRLLLVDSGGLLAQASRDEGGNLEFSWHEMIPLPDLSTAPTDEFVMVHALLGRTTTGGARGRSGGIQAFLDTGVGISGKGGRISVRDLVKHYANVEGGVHLGRARDSKQAHIRAVIALTTGGFFDKAILDIARITHRAGVAMHKSVGGSWVGGDTDCGVDPVE